MDSVAGGSMWHVLHCKMATSVKLAKLACSQLSDGECYTRRTYLVFPQPVPLSDLQALMTATPELRNTFSVNKKHGKIVQFNHIYLFIHSFQHSVSYLRQTQLQRLLSSELFTILEYTAERLVTAIDSETLSLNEYYTKY